MENQIKHSQATTSSTPAKTLRPGKDCTSDSSTSTVASVAESIDDGENNNNNNEAPKKTAKSEGKKPKQNRTKKASWKENSRGDRFSGAISFFRNHKPQTSKFAKVVLGNTQLTPNQGVGVYHFDDWNEMTPSNLNPHAVLAVVRQKLEAKMMIRVLQDCEEHYRAGGNNICVMYPRGSELSYVQKILRKFALDQQVHVQGYRMDMYPADYPEGRRLYDYTLPDHDIIIMTDVYYYNPATLFMDAPCYAEWIHHSMKTPKTRPLIAYVQLNDYRIPEGLYPNPNNQKFGFVSVPYKDGYWKKKKNEGEDSKPSFRYKTFGATKTENYDYFIRGPPALPEGCQLTWASKDEVPRVDYMKDTAMQFLDYPSGTFALHLGDSWYDIQYYTEVIATCPLTGKRQLRVCYHFVGKCLDIKGYLHVTQPVMDVSEIGSPRVLFSYRCTEIRPTSASVPISASLYDNYTTAFNDMLKVSQQVDFSLPKVYGRFAGDFTRAAMSKIGHLPHLRYALDDEVKEVDFVSLFAQQCQQVVHDYVIKVAYQDHEFPIPTVDSASASAAQTMRAQKLIDLLPDDVRRSLAKLQNQKTLPEFISNAFEVLWGMAKGVYRWSSSVIEKLKQKLRNPKSSKSLDFARALNDLVKRIPFVRKGTKKLLTVRWLKNLMTKLKDWESKPKTKIEKLLIAIWEVIFVVGKTFAEETLKRVFPLVIFLIVVVETLDSKWRVFEEGDLSAIGDVFLESAGRLWTHSILFLLPLPISFLLHATWNVFDHFYGAAKRERRFQYILDLYHEGQEEMLDAVELIAMKNNSEETCYNRELVDLLHAKVVTDNFQFKEAKTWKSFAHLDTTVLEDTFYDKPVQILSLGMLLFKYVARSAVYKVMAPMVRICNYNDYVDEVLIQRDNKLISDTWFEIARLRKTKVFEDLYTQHHTEPLTRDQFVEHVKDHFPGFKAGKYLYAFDLLENHFGFDALMHPKQYTGEPKIFNMPKSDEKMLPKTYTKTRTTLLTAGFQAADLAKFDRLELIKPRNIGMLHQLTHVPFMRYHIPYNKDWLEGVNHGYKCGSLFMDLHQYRLDNLSIPFTFTCAYGFKCNDVTTWNDSSVLDGIHVIWFSDDVLWKFVKDGISYYLPLDVKMFDKSCREEALHFVRELYKESGFDKPALDSFDYSNMPGWKYFHMDTLYGLDPILARFKDSYYCTLSGTSDTGPRANRIHLGVILYIASQLWLEPHDQQWNPDIIEKHIFQGYKNSGFEVSGASTFGSIASADFLSGRFWRCNDNLYRYGPISPVKLIAVGTPVRKMFSFKYDTLTSQKMLCWGLSQGCAAFRITPVADAILAKYQDFGNSLPLELKNSKDIVTVTQKIFGTYERPAYSSGKLSDHWFPAIYRLSDSEYLQNCKEYGEAVGKPCPIDSYQELMLLIEDMVLFQGDTVNNQFWNWLMTVHYG